MASSAAICCFAMRSMLIVMLAPTVVSANEEIEEATTVLFPWFVQAMGVLVFFALSRYVHALPYTAVMFVLGAFMGIGVARREGDNELAHSIAQWLDIDSEVLLLVFLPGLIFKDAFGLNIHLFQLSFSQLLVFAFPMVLAGTTLTACVAFYIFPYDWSFDLAMTFGAILSATDPVAVSALLAEVGAPPRLKMHVSGESLLNDGSALVFFQIFSGLFLIELGNENLGESLTVGEGFAKFFRASLGGTAIGIGFGMGLVAVLYCLSRRLIVEENVVQVAATITFAYLTYYIADVVAETSGVIAVVFCGVAAKAFGGTMINDEDMMDSFWILTEHLLNTVLFALGGVVWGEVIANPSGRALKFEAKDWGYLFLLYLLLHAIRYFLMYSFYPLTARIGLSTNLRETFFMSFGGLRGAVGIALAISLDSTVENGTEDPEFREQTSTLFGMVGGIAFLTLIINGSLSGPVLKKLGLTSSTEIRERIVDCYRGFMEDHFLDEFIALLTDMRFRKVDYSIVSHHIPQFRTLTAEEFKRAVEKNKQAVPPGLYKAPYTDNVLSFLEGEKQDAENAEDGSAVAEQVEDVWEVVERSCLSRPQDEDEKDTKAATSSVAIELRLIFIELLRSSYQEQIKKGEIDPRRFVAYVLLESLELASVEVNKGKPLCDFEMLDIVNGAWLNSGDNVIRKAGKRIKKGGQSGLDNVFQQLKVDIHVSLAFLEAHWHAQERFEQEFVGGEFSAEEKLIISESKDQVRQVAQELRSRDAKAVENVVSHLLCAILLNKGARYIEYITKAGLLRMKEATEFIESIEEALDNIHRCAKDKHGENDGCG